MFSLLSVVFQHSVNKYSSLVGTKPGLILPCTAKEISPEARAIIAAKRSQFTKTVVEVGSGSGGHMIAQASARPDPLFVGFELRYKRVFRTAEKAEELGLKNILVIQRNATFLNEIFEPNSLNEIHVLFPDPWDKRRWKKHRILSRAILEACR